MRPHEKSSRRTFLGLSGVAAAWALAGRRAQGAVERPVRFGLVTDCHYADRDPANTRHYRESLDKLTQSIDTLNAEQVDFVVELGDFKDQDTPPVPEQTLDYLRRIEDAFARFQGPRFHVLGNHDMDSLSKAQFQGEVENTGIASEKTFYSFDIKGLHGVVLDANFRSDGTPYDRGQFDWTDANLPEAQLAWLREDLRTSTGPVTVFVHQRLDGQGSLFVKNAAEVRGILEESKRVAAVFQGHDHPGAFSQLNGIPYYTLKATVEGPGNAGVYAVAEIGSAGQATVNGNAVKEEAIKNAQPR